MGDTEKGSGGFVGGLSFEIHSITYVQAVPCRVAVLSCSARKYPKNRPGEALQMWSIHRGQKSKHITPTPKRPPLGTPPAAARQLHAQRSGFTVGAIIDRPLATPHPLHLSRWATCSHGYDLAAVLILTLRAVNDRPYDGIVPFRPHPRRGRRPRRPFPDALHSRPRM